MKDLRVYLKVKIKTLAAEARIIRREEQRAGDHVRPRLAQHRRTVVRQAMRETLLAYAFIRGRSYRSIEANPKTAPDWAAVGKMVDKYGTCITSPEDYAIFKGARIDQANRFAKWMREPKKEPTVFREMMSDPGMAVIVPKQVLVTEQTS